MGCLWVRVQRSWSEGTGADLEAICRGIGTSLNQPVKMEILSFWCW